MTAPPSGHDSRYEPPVFEYTLSTLPGTDLGVRQSGYRREYAVLHDCERPEGFQYNNPGYELHLTGLPEGELTFTLCGEGAESPAAIGYVYPEVLLIGAAVWLQLWL